MTDLYIDGARVGACGAEAIPVVDIAGVLFCALPFSLETAALRRMPAKVYGTLTSLEPATGAVMGFAFLGERLTAVQWDGVAAIGVATTSRIDILPPAVTL